jgi:hypothetical protein
VQHLPLATGVNVCCHDELSQYLFVAKVSFHLHGLLHEFLCDRSSVIEELQRKQFIKYKEFKQKENVAKL